MAFLTGVSHAAKDMAKRIEEFNEEKADKDSKSI